MPFIQANDIRVGNIVEYEDAYYKVVERVHVKPGKGGAFCQLEMKGIKTGRKLNVRLRSEEKINLMLTDTLSVQCLYFDDKLIYTIDLATGEQNEYALNLIEKDLIPFLKDEMMLTVHVIENEASSIDLPNTAVYKVIETQPYIKGQTVKSSFKPAMLENKETISVPEFIEEGNEVLINIYTREYQERADKKK